MTAIKNRYKLNKSALIGALIALSRGTNSLEQIYKPYMAYKNSGDLLKQIRVSRELRDTSY